MIINVYRQIQQEAFGIVLINKQNKVRKRIPLRFIDMKYSIGFFGSKMKNIIGVFQKVN